MMRCHYCTQIAVTECRECGKPICHVHDRRGNPRDLKYNGGFFKKDYCHPCYDAAHKEAVECNLMMCAIILPIVIVLLLVLFSRMYA